ncbi:hemolysin family protein [uncultured Mobiluncus sp.]|uniref:hemolysin family protein n=1 Tax=uncultured Mobiluncus sp. TaxID=293425 RepID=UPI0025E1FC7B|nr:hemolysin family protein [uncultured Mobiluncus sp.]
MGRLSPVVADWLLVAVGILLTLANAFFVATEFAFLAVDPARVAGRAANGDKRAALVKDSISNLSTQLSGTQVGITLSTILLGYTTQQAIANLVTRGLGHTGMALAAATALGAVVALVITNLYSMVFGELIPKNLALADPMKAAGFVVRPQRAFTFIFKPLIVVLKASANFVLDRIGVEVVEELSGAHSAQELVAMVRQSAEEGLLDLSTASLFTRSVHISGLAAKDVMTDRGRVHYLTQNDTADDLIAKARETGHSRFPVIGPDGLDDILGFANLRRAVSVPYERRGEVVVTSSSLMYEVPRVPETMGLADLMVLLRDAGSQTAVVVDEYGGTSGIVTLEDAVEEIVGEVADEHDQHAAGINHPLEGEWLVPGLIRPDELLIQTKVELPDEGPYETLGGLIMNELGHIPSQGETVSVNGYLLRVEQMDGRRIDRVRITRNSVPGSRLTSPEATHE